MPKLIVEEGGKGIVRVSHQQRPMSEFAHERLQFYVD